MGALVLLLILSTFASSATCQLHSTEAGYISAVISERGLIFAKDLLVQQAIETLTDVRLPDIKKSKRIPLIGVVSASLTNITIYHINVSCSTIQPGESGLVIEVSGASMNLSMNWKYSYSTWLVPIEISDSGSASVQVKGMEVGLTINVKAKEGTLVLNVTQAGCYVEDISITLDGGISWFYQGFVDAFEDHIRSTLETTIAKKITEGALKLDSLLQKIPKQIDVDKTAALNVTLVHDPLFGNFSVEIDINGLFIQSAKVVSPSYLNKHFQTSVFCRGELKMLEISLDEAVFNSGSAVYFQAGLLHWLVDKVPDQSLLNTASWKFVIPQLYRKYPNDDMQLNLTFTSPPVIKITSKNIGATILSDMTVNVLDAGETVPVACISMVVSATGIIEISGNNLAGTVALDDFTLTLKWSKVGDFHMNLIQGVMRVFLNTICIPYVNLHLRKGFPLPIIHGLALQNGYLSTSDSKVVVCTDVINSNFSYQNMVQYL